VTPLPIGVAPCRLRRAAGANRGIRAHHLSPDSTLGTPAPVGAPRTSGRTAWTSDSTRALGPYNEAGRGRVMGRAAGDVISEPRLMSTGQAQTGSGERLRPQGLGRGPADGSQWS